MIVEMALLIALFVSFITGRWYGSFCQRKDDADAQVADNQPLYWRRDVIMAEARKKMEKEEPRA